jgi:hypothetical protein
VASAAACSRLARATGFAAGCALGLGGCAINPSLNLAEFSAATAPILLDAPFHPQEENQCGPAALATVLGAAGVETTPEALSPGLYLPAREGSLQVEILAQARGAHSTCSMPPAGAQRARIGRPARAKPRTPASRLALCGAGRLDVRRNELRLNSGATAGLAVTAPRFLRTWDWAGRWRWSPAAG